MTALLVSPNFSKGTSVEGENNKVAQNIEQTDKCSNSICEERSEQTIFDTSDEHLAGLKGDNTR